MLTLPEDEKLFRAAKFAYEYPGFWDKPTPQGRATISDGPTEEAAGGQSGGKWSVQLLDHSDHYIRGRDFATAREAILYVLGGCYG